MSSLANCSTATPAVSVLMPVYNSARFLDAAIKSVLKQTFTDFEFVIVDDGSTDATPAILAHYQKLDARVVLLRQSNGGIAAALNAGLAVCRGQYIARMDGDDIADLDRLEVQRKFLDDRAEIGAVGGWARVIDEHSMPIGQLTHPTRPIDVDRAVQAGAYAMLHPSMMIRRQCLLDIGGYDPAFRYAEDLDLLLRLAEVTALANLPRIVLSYRRRNQVEDAARGDVYPAWDQRALLRRTCEASGRPRRRPWHARRNACRGRRSTIMTTAPPPRKHGTRFDTHLYRSSAHVALIRVGWRRACDGLRTGATD